MLFGIWDFEANDWVRELPSQVDDGGVAILAYASEARAKQRACKHWAAGSYAELVEDGNGEVRPLP